MHVDEPDPEPAVLPGSVVAFTKNGQYEGVAYRCVVQAKYHRWVTVKLSASAAFSVAVTCALRDIMEGTYYPAASLFTHPLQAEGASVTFNFGEPPGVHWMASLGRERSLCMTMVVQGIGSLLGVL